MMFHFGRRKKPFRLALVALIVGAFTFGGCAVLDWAGYDLDLPAQDCLMNTWTIQGTVTDEANNPVDNAKVDIRGHQLVCENNVLFPIVVTDPSGAFGLSKDLYSPIVKDWNGPTVEPTARAQLLKLNGEYEITVTADGYEPYYRSGLTDDEVFGGLHIVLKRR